MSKRAVIWAGVSSRPQARQDSIDNQVADARRLCAEKTWEVADVLRVPGESRNYIDLADAVAGLDAHLRAGEENAYRRLLEMLDARALDVLVCRARDRLGRTDALIAGIEERCRRAGVLVYSMSMPPSGSETGDLYVSAVERAGAQHEVLRLVQRTRDGMDTRARRGQPIGSRVVFGYRPVYAQSGERVERRAAIVPEAAAAFRGVVSDTLNRSATQVELVQRLRSQFPHLTWSTAALYGMLRNPFYAGLIQRRRERKEGETAVLRVLAPIGPSVLDNPAWPEAERTLAARAEREYFNNRDRLGRLKIYLIAVGQHEPILDLSEWVSLQRVMDERSRSHRPASRSSLWSGMVVCGLCGARYHYYGTQTNYRGKLYFHRYYRCGGKGAPEGGGCDNPNITHEAVTAGVVSVLSAMYAALANEVEEVALASEPKAVDMLAGWEAQRADLMAQRERLEIMAQTGRISLDAFDERAGKVDAALADVGARLARERAILASREASAVRMLALGEMLPNLAERLDAADPVQANRWLKEAIEAVVVADRQVVEVRLR